MNLELAKNLLEVKGLIIRSADHAEVVIALAKEELPDLSKAVELDTVTLTGQSEAHHLDVSLSVGRGSTDGKLIVAVSFGSRTVEDALDL